MGPDTSHITSSRRRTYASCIDLEVLIKEMMDYDILSDLQWKEIVRLGKAKFNFPAASK
jgi:hypothetical protein